LSRIDERFPRITAIHRDKINGRKVILGFNARRYEGRSTPEKVDYILGTSKEEREYIYSVFSNATSNHLFSSHDGKYEIYYPVEAGGNRKVILHLSQFSRYGKIGS
jgi:hypothetical protein